MDASRTDNLFIISFLAGISIKNNSTPNLADPLAEIIQRLHCYTNEWAFEKMNDAKVTIIVSTIDFLAEVLGK